ncbi:hypothetical protein D9611_011398 [Ephemerocybe angulata]|uniref:Uncharacterized protein n=1 Tax=Ephemerocybe angulata TaxID=980116 RepID=A0A8H5BCD7_9AGAR|nr:hypothetical protein D9611_011398 [Tulosesus angulatus]
MIPEPNRGSRLTAAIARSGNNGQGHDDRRFTPGNDSVGRDGLREEMGRAVLRPNERGCSRKARLQHDVADAWQEVRGLFWPSQTRAERRYLTLTSPERTDRTRRISTTITNSRRTTHTSATRFDMTTPPHNGSRRCRNRTQRGDVFNPDARRLRRGRRVTVAQKTHAHFPAYHNVKPCDGVRCGGVGATENGYGMSNLAVQAPLLSLRRPPQPSTSTMRHGVRPSDPERRIRVY